MDDIALVDVTFERANMRLVTNLTDVGGVLLVWLDRRLMRERDFWRCEGVYRLGQGCAGAGVRGSKGFRVDR